MIHKLTLVAVLGSLCGPSLVADAEQSGGSRSRGVEAGEDWPNIFGPRGEARSIERGLRWNWPSQGPEVLWQTRLDEGYGICTLQDGRVYAFDGPGDEERLRCLSSRDGAKLWEFRYASDYRDLFNYSNGPRCSPVLDGERIYLFGVAGTLHCLSRQDGKVLWQSDTQNRFGVVQNFFGVGSTPVVFEDLLLVMVGGSPPASQSIPPGQLDRVQGNGSAIVAFDKMTGAVRYRLSDELASYASLKLATIHGKTWCLAFVRGGLLAFDPRTGTQEFFFPWRASKLESVNASTPVVVGNEVLISETYGPGAALLHCRPGGFDVVWSDIEKRRDKSLQTHWNTPVYHNGFVFASSGRHASEAELRCVEWSTGKVVWTKPGLTRCSLLYADGHLVCLGEDGVLRALKANPERYEEVSVCHPRTSATQGGLPLLKPPAWAGPVISHGRLYVRGADRLVCFQMRQ